jgi:hypothetical protein
MSENICFESNIEASTNMNILCDYSNKEIIVENKHREPEESLLTIGNSLSYAQSACKVIKQIENLSSFGHIYKILCFMPANYNIIVFHRCSSVNIKCCNDAVKSEIAKCTFFPF